MATSSSIHIFDGRAVLHPPTAKRATWRVIYWDSITRERKQASGGRTRESAEHKAASVLGLAGATARGQSPTLEETFKRWKAENTSRWSARTVSNYDYTFKRHMEALGQQRVETITPEQVGAVDIAHMSRQQRQKLRTIMRGVFKVAGDWVRLDPERYAQAVTLTGTSEGKTQRRVERGEIPDRHYVFSLVRALHMVAYPEDVQTIKRGAQDKDDIATIPKALIDRHKRGRPKHYKNIEDIEAREAAEIQGIFRRHLLAILMGAGAGLRVGEVLALRLGHLYTRSEIRAMVRSIEDTGQARATLHEGAVTVQQQASQESGGRIIISLPKMGRERLAHLPWVLPSPWTEQTATYTNEDGSEATTPHEMSRDDAIKRLFAREGFYPAWLVVQDVTAEIVQRAYIKAEGDTAEAVTIAERALLFPTRNPARKAPDPAEGHRFFAGACALTGGNYQASSNFSTRVVYPLMDTISTQTDSHPSRLTGRRGWTFHHLRHFAISTRLQAGQPLPEIAEQMGHKHGGFTLERYGHMVAQRAGAMGFQF